MRNRVRHSLKLAARVGSKHLFVRRILFNLLYFIAIPFDYLHQFIIYAYSFITPPCFYSPGREFHFSLSEEREAIIISLQHKQKRMIQQHQEKRLKLLLISFVLVLLACKLHPSAHASNASMNIGVSASVAPKCKVFSSTMAFGTYDPQVNTNLDVNGSILLSCTKNTTATISLDNGVNASHATGTTRSMQNITTSGSGNSSFMSYELYKNPARTSVWNTSSPLSITATTAAQVAVPVYGRVPQGQNTQDGGYQDTVLITVNF